jgi:hypothetical protein
MFAKSKRLVGCSTNTHPLRHISLRSKPDIVLLFILIAAVLVSSFFILQDSGTVPQFPMDQYFVDSVNLRIYKSPDGIWIFQYPPLQNAGGITSALIAGIYKLLIPTQPETLNWHIRILAMLMYISSSFMLVRVFIEDRWTRVLSFLIIVTSGYQFIQPSSELFAGTLLNLFFVFVWRSWPLWMSSFALATFGLCKVELSLAALAIAFFCAFRLKHKVNPNAWKILPYTIGWMALLLAPGFFVEGGSAFSGNRSYLAFIATYVELFQPHQFIDLSQLSSEESNQLVRRNIIGSSESVLSIALNHPNIYIDFLALQSVRSVTGIISGLKLMLIPWLAVIRRINTLGKTQNILIILLLASILTLFPAWLLAYIRLRYLVKLFPAIIAIVALCCLSLEVKKKGYKSLYWMSGISTIVWQLIWLPSMYQQSQFQ